MKFSSYHSGGLFGMEYFLQKGEKISMHNHRRFGDEHNIIVLKGAVELRGGGDKSSIYLGQGVVLDFNGMMNHEIVAVEDSHILNLYIHGRPDNFVEGATGET